MFMKKGEEIRLDKVTEEITSVERPNNLGDQYLGSIFWRMKRSAEKRLDYLRR